MKKVVYSDHLKFRLKLRKIPYLLPIQIYKLSKERYFDVLTKNFVAVKRVLYKGKSRDIMVAHTESSVDVILITIHPLKSEQKFNRIRNNRWQRL